MSYRNEVGSGGFAPVVTVNYLLDPDGNILLDPDGNPLLAGDGS